MAIVGYALGWDVGCSRTNGTLTLGVGEEGSRDGVLEFRSFSISILQLEQFAFF